jgi:hypothetical protein
VEKQLETVGLVELGGEPSLTVGRCSSASIVWQEKWVLVLALVTRNEKQISLGFGG